MNILMQASSAPLVPAEAGTQTLLQTWVPASAGTNGAGFQAEQFCSRFRPATPLVTTFYQAGEVKVRSEG
jgi:hypothetical protein